MQTIVDRQIEAYITHRYNLEDADEEFTAD
jgi:hypothetical protein